MNQTVVFAGGGTGGHIYPGIALAQHLKLKQNNIKSVFIGSKQGLEQKIFKNTDYLLKTTWAKAFNQGSVLTKTKSLFWNLPIATLQAIVLLIKIKPKWVLSMGGYAAVPVGLAAFLLGIPLFTWEPNAKAGLANRLLSYFSRLNFIIFDEVKSQLKGECIKTGLPLRLEIKNQIKKEKKIFYKDQDFKILIVGGSLGSQFLNKKFCKLWHLLKDQNLSIIHQSGERYFLQTKKDYKIYDTSKNINYKVYKYLSDIYKQYQWADLVISRSGTGSVFELAACGKASILLPYTNSADQHQLKNAATLAKSKQAIMMEEKDFSDIKIKNLIQKFILEPTILSELEKNISTLYLPDTEDFILNTIHKFCPS